MSTAPKHRYTVGQYLSFERGSDSKHEYFDGEIFAMVGASREHVLIVTQLVTMLNSQLADRPCEVYSNDMRLRVTPTGLYTYPDVMVVCGEPQFDDSTTDMLLNPNVIFEVLSDSTEQYDRKVKLQHYRTVPSLTDYVLVAQDAYRLTYHSRQSDGAWASREVEGAEATLILNSIGCKLELREIYRKVDL
jgi:Uma2 family endonuclease